MHNINIQEILPLVETPSRYLGCEANSIVKNPDQVDLMVALAFPDLYEIGTSHFGMQILYTILNQQDHIAAERFFTPAPDLENLLSEKQTPLFSLESKLSMKAFDMVGFSLLYELNFTNILTMLSLSGIPFYASDRAQSEEAYPLIIGGGPCAFNPEPLADFFDAFVIGDGEEVVLQISNTVIEWKKREDGNHKELLKTLASIQGVYVPSFFKAVFKPLEIAKGSTRTNRNTGEGTDATDQRNEVFQYLEPLKPGYETVKRAILPDLTSAPFPTAPVVPFGKPVHDRLRLEVARGCSRGCRFCQAGMIYRPVRERSVEDLVSIAEDSMKNTGYSDISLLSLSTGDYGNLAPLMSSLLTINPGHCTALSLPSVRAGKLTAPLMEIIKSVKKTGFTIAPEAGTQRLRDVINKNITEEDIFTTVNSAFDLGWRTIKLYFMNGLPTETEEDLEGLVDLTYRLISSQATRGRKDTPQGKKGGKKGKGRLNINVSFGTFIPKAHTPFQRCAQISPEQSLSNLDYLKANLRHPGIKLKWQNPWMSLLEGVWARGDRRLAKVLVAAWEKGCRMDGWSDMFRIDLWMDAFEESGVDPYFFTARERRPEEPLPWDHLDCGISKRYMEKELDNALAGRITEDCRDHECTGCGICDFKTVQPLLFPSLDSSDSGGFGASADSADSDAPANTVGSAESASTATPKTDSVSIAALSPILSTQDDFFSKFTVFYTRMDDARHFGHLELAKIIRRAIRRTGIQVKYSKGFSPSMKISFDNPLPVGMQSEEEFFHIHAHIKTDPNIIVGRLNKVLPRSITITRCLPTAKVKNLTNAAQKKGNPTRYRIDLKTHVIPEEVVDAFMSVSEYIVEQVNHKGVRRQIDLRKVTQTIRFTDPRHPSRLEMTLIKDGERTIRPAEILTEALHVPEEVLLSADTIKLKN